MIERLFIKNYAIIDVLELEFGKGFHVFTGETGAGKSIIVGALGLLLGEKGDSSVIRSGEERALIEAEFNISDPYTLERIKELQIDAADSLIIRREIVQNGKSRVFINGLQEPLSKLEELGEWLVDIHGQHDHQLLLNQKVHLDILDSYGNLKNEKVVVKNLYTQLMKKIEELKELEQDEKKLEEEKVFWETAIEEIEKTDLQPNEEIELTDSLKKMENAEKISVSFNDAFQYLYEDEQSVSTRLSKAVSAVKDLAGFDKRYEELLEILEDAFAKVDECANMVSHYRDELDFDQKVMEETIDRLELIKDFKRKYKKNNVPELIQYAGECREKLKRFENRAEELGNLTKEIAQHKAELIDKSMQLSRKRQETARELAQKIKSELAFLGMDKSEFVVDIKYVRDDSSPIIINNIAIKVNETGIDRVEFFISSNVGEEPRPLKKVASGGEISRVMLALKSIFSKSDSIETLIFDEIDVGIGGLTANNVGVRMGEIAKSRQIVVITHLAQIASKASHHYFISKTVKDGKTFTEVDKIEGGKRIEETARMLGGESAKALAHAKEMLGI
jgi:DNA repair protein RecN (Recombination protein N)